MSTETILVVILAFLISRYADYRQNKNPHESKPSNSSTDQSKAEKNNSADLHEDDDKEEAPKRPRRWDDQGDTIKREQLREYLKDRIN